MLTRTLVSFQSYPLYQLFYAVFLMYLICSALQIRLGDPINKGRRELLSGYNVVYSSSLGLTKQSMWRFAVFRSSSRYPSSSTSCLRPLAWTSGNGSSSSPSTNNSIPISSKSAARKMWFPVSRCPPAARWRWVLVWPLHRSSCSSARSSSSANTHPKRTRSSWQASTLICSPVIRRMHYTADSQLGQYVTWVAHLFHPDTGPYKSNFQATNASDAVKGITQNSIQIISFYEKSSTEFKINIGELDTVLKDLVIAQSNAAVKPQVKLLFSFTYTQLVESVFMSE